jgi:hypothetical protein
MFNLFLKYRSVIFLLIFSFIILNFPFVIIAAEESPFTEHKRLQDLLDIIIKYLGSFVAGIAVLYIIIAGIRYVTAQGPEAAGAAKEAFISTLIGTAIVIAAWGIVSLVRAILFKHLSYY